MNTLKHTTANIGLGIILLSILNKSIISNELLIIILSGILIDIDHIFVAIFSGRIKHPKKLIKYWSSIVNEHTGELYVFHSYEFLTIILIIGFFNNLFLFIFLGLLFHFIFDGITEYRDIKSMKWIKDYSIIFHVIRFSKT